MTYIEFFDASAIENVCAVLTLASERVILVGSDADELNKSCSRYEKLMASRGKSVKFLPKVVVNTNLKTIVDSLSDMIRAEADRGGECVIDLTGGNDLYLAAAGIVYGRLTASGVKLNLVRFDITRGTVVDVDGDGLPVFPDIPGITVEENVRIYGGKVVFDNEKKGTTLRWTVDDALREDVSALWDICRRDFTEWNTQTLFLDIIEDADSVVFRRGNTTESSFEKIDAVVRERRSKGDLSGRKTPRDIEASFLDELTQKGILKEYSLTPERIKLVYRDERVKQLITKSGQVLEMAIFLAICDIKDSDGRRVYNDVMTGVTIDWDGKLVEKNLSCNIPDYMMEKYQDTENEIDVMVMRGMVPIFISCKNGRVDMDELYKLETVAKRFGGKYAKKILIATNLKKSAFTWDLVARANEMDIKVVYENFGRVDLQHLQQKIKDVMDSWIKKD